jgi:ABC-type nitrate/sulfonate/bicarbonate transport system substrate-binding protein
MRSLLYFSWLAFVASPAFAADPVRVGYASQTIIFGGPVQCGIEQGFFARLGLGIVPTTYSGGAKLHQAMAAGAVDLALASITDMALLVKGAPERVIYGVVNAPYSVSIMALNPAIRSADDLKGRKIGVTTAGSYTYWLVSQLPRFLHWDSGRAMPVSVGGVLSGQMAALVSGQIDALVGEVGVGLTLEQEKRGRIVLNAADMVHDVPASVVFGETTFLRDHPDVAARFIQGLRFRPRGDEPGGRSHEPGLVTRWADHRGGADGDGAGDCAGWAARGGAESDAPPRADLHAEVIGPK